MTFWESVGEAALAWVFYGLVIVTISLVGAIVGEDWRASGCKFRTGWRVFKYWLFAAFMFLLAYLPGLLKEEPDASWALGTFAANSLIYFLAASGGGPVAEYWREAGFFQAKADTHKAQDASGKEPDDPRPSS